MVFVQVCVGSSCHLKGSREIVTMLQKQIEQDRLADEVVLSGSFCTGQCNRLGVTITVNDDIYTGITPETFGAFWSQTLMPRTAAKEEDENVKLPDAEKIQL